VPALEQDKRRVIFVDDDPNVLTGLRRMLRPVRQEWDMAFADGGEAALAMLAEHAFDVIVSDMRMPGMDGAQLLGEVQRGYPSMVRIALSGHSEMKMLLRSTRVAHQFLAKPCGADELKRAVVRSLALRAMLCDPKLETLASRLDTLPSLPAVYVELTDELRSDNGTIQRVGEIIGHDVAMSAKILQLVNSAFFGLRRHVASPGDAVRLLGLEVIQGMVLGAGVFKALETHVAGFSQDALWRHSMEVSAVARAIARSEGLEHHAHDFSFQAALLHDIGKLVFAANLPQQYAQALALAGERGGDLVGAETEVFGHTHAALGAYLLGLWGLPDAVVEAVAYHHAPQGCADHSLGPVTVVHAANALVHETDGAVAREPGIDAGYLAEVGAAARIDAWSELAGEALGAAA